MSNLDIGITAANRSSWRGHDARSILRRIVEAAPDIKDKEAIRREFLDAAMSPATLDDVKTYYFDRNFADLMRTLQRQRETPQERAERLEAQRESKRHHEENEEANFDQIIADEAQRLLLDWIMPNGKMLRDCTRGQAESMANQILPWITVLCADLQLDDVIGEHRSEADARKAAVIVGLNSLAA